MQARRNPAPQKTRLTRGLDDEEPVMQELGGSIADSSSSKCSRNSLGNSGNIKQARGGSAVRTGAGAALLCGAAAAAPTSPVPTAPSSKVAAQNSPAPALCRHQTPRTLCSYVWAGLTPGGPEGEDRLCFHCHLLEPGDSSAQGRSQASRMARQCPTGGAEQIDQEGPESEPLPSLAPTAQGRLGAVGKPGRVVRLRSSWPVPRHCHFSAAPRSPCLPT